MNRRRALMCNGVKKQRVKLDFENAPLYYLKSNKNYYAKVAQYDDYCGQFQVVDNIPVFKVLDYDFKQGKKYKLEITLYQTLQNEVWQDAPESNLRFYQSTKNMTTPWNKTSTIDVNGFIVESAKEVVFTPVENFKYLYIGFYFSKTTYVKFGNVYITEV